MQADVQRGQHPELSFFQSLLRFDPYLTTIDAPADLSASVERPGCVPHGREGDKSWPFSLVMDYTDRAATPGPASCLPTQIIASALRSEDHSPSERHSSQQPLLAPAAAEQLSRGASHPTDRLSGEALAHPALPSPSGPSTASEVDVIDANSVERSRAAQKRYRERQKVRWSQV